MTILGWWICLAAILDQKDSASSPLMSSSNSLFESSSFIVYPLSFLILLIILTTKFFAFSSYACALPKFAVKTATSIHPTTHPSITPSVAMSSTTYNITPSLVDDPRHNLEKWTENVETHARSMCATSSAWMWLDPLVFGPPGDYNRYLYGINFGPPGD